MSAAVPPCRYLKTLIFLFNQYLGQEFIYGKMQNNEIFQLNSVDFDNTQNSVCSSESEVVQAEAVAGQEPVVDNADSRTSTSILHASAQPNAALQGEFQLSDFLASDDLRICNLEEVNSLRFDYKFITIEQKVAYAFESREQPGEGQEGPEPR